MDAEGESFAVPILGVLLIIVSVRGAVQAVKQHMQNHYIKLQTDAADIMQHEVYRSVIKPTMQRAMSGFLERCQDRREEREMSTIQLYAELYRDMTIGPQCFAEIMDRGVQALRTRNRYVTRRQAHQVLRQAYFETRVYQSSFATLTQMSRIIASGYESEEGRKFSSRRSTTSTPIHHPSLEDSDEGGRASIGAGGTVCGSQEGLQDGEVADVLASTHHREEEEQLGTVGNNNHDQTDDTHGAEKRSLVAVTIV